MIIKALFTNILYVDQVDEQKLIGGAIRGMLFTLDPHSVYMSPAVFKELKVDTSGRFDGVGIGVAIRDAQDIIRNEKTRGKPGVRCQRTTSLT